MFEIHRLNLALFSLKETKNNVKLIFSTKDSQEFF